MSPTGIFFTISTTLKDRCILQDDFVLLPYCHKLQFTDISHECRKFIKTNKICPFSYFFPQYNRPFVL